MDNVRGWSLPPVTDFDQWLGDRDPEWRDGLAPVAYDPESGGWLWAETEEGPVLAKRLSFVTSKKFKQTLHTADGRELKGDVRWLIY